jgi:hypothetical protein
MTWREWALKYLSQERDSLVGRIGLMEAGRIWFGETRDGVSTDITAELIERDKANLAELERIIAEAAAPNEGEAHG